MDFCQVSLPKIIANVLTERSSWDVSNFGPVRAFPKTWPVPVSLLENLSLFTCK